MWCYVVRYCDVLCGIIACCVVLMERVAEKGHTSREG